MLTYDDLTNEICAKFDKAVLGYVKKAVTKLNIPFKNPEVWSTNNNPWIDFDVALKMKYSDDDLRVRLTYEVDRKKFTATVFVLDKDGSELYTRSGNNLEALIDKVFRRYTAQHSLSI